MGCGDILWTRSDMYTLHCMRVDIAPCPSLSARGTSIDRDVFQ